MAWGELRERQDFTQPIQRMEEEERVKDEGERLIFSLIFIANIDRKIMNSRPGS